MNGTTQELSHHHFECVQARKFLLTKEKIPTHTHNIHILHSEHFVIYKENLY